MLNMYTGTVGNSVPVAAPAAAATGSTNIGSIIRSTTTSSSNGNNQSSMELLSSPRAAAAADNFKRNFKHVSEEELELLGSGHHSWLTRGGKRRMVATIFDNMVSNEMRRFSYVCDPPCT